MANLNHTTTASRSSIAAGSRRKANGGTAHTGDALPPLPAIPEPEMTPAEAEKKRAQEAEISRMLKEIRAHQIELNLDRALRLVQMAQRGQGPLIDYLTDLGFRYAKLADTWPRKPGLRVIQGGAD